MFHLHISFFDIANCAADTQTESTDNQQQQTPIAKSSQGFMETEKVAYRLHFTNTGSCKTALKSFRNLTSSYYSTSTFSTVQKL